MFGNLWDLKAAQFEVPAYFDYLATLTWAISGAIVGARRGYDIVGVFVIALLSSMGGGLLRDGFLLQRTPALLTNGAYLTLIAVAVAVVVFFARWPRWKPGPTAVDKLISIIDAIGVPAFVVVGMQLALSLGLSEPGVVLVGVVNGVGGGLLRDVIAGERPLLLQPGQYQSLQVFVSAVFFLFISRYLEVPATQAGLATLGLHFAVGTLIVRYNWRSEAVLRHEPREPGKP